MEEQRIPVAEGVSLQATVWDEGVRLPEYLLIHGLSSNRRTWEGVAAQLAAAGHRVATLDLRGHGRSDKPASGYDFATLTRDIMTAMAGLGLERPVVAGQSTGGNLAVELAHRASDLVSGVVGVDGGVIELQSRFPEWQDCLAALAPPRFEGTPVERFREMIRMHHPAWPDWGVEATLANCEVLEDGTVRPWLARDNHLVLLRALWEHRPSSIVGDLDVPLLLILASPDADAGWLSEKQTAAAQAEAANPAHVGVSWLEGDHDLHVHHAEVVADLILGLHG